MGQAKQRGTFEQRQAEGIAKRKARDAKRLERHILREAALTPEQKAQRHNAALMVAMIAGITLPLP